MCRFKIQSDAKKKKKTSEKHTGHKTLNAHMHTETRINFFTANYVPSINLMTHKSQHKIYSETGLFIRLKRINKSNEIKITMKRDNLFRYKSSF